jgi:hypothetical protein
VAGDPFFDTRRPGKAGLKAGHEAFSQAYASNGGNAADAYRKAYPRCKSAHAAVMKSRRLKSQLLHHRTSVHWGSRSRFLISKRWIACQMSAEEWKKQYVNPG